MLLMSIKLPQLSEFSPLQILILQFRKLQTLTITLCLLLHEPKTDTQIQATLLSHLTPPFGGNKFEA